MNIKTEINNLIIEALENLNLEKVDFVVEHPENFDNGDYSTNVAMVLAKKEKQKPKDLAQKIVEKILEDNSRHYVEDIQVAGNGFINFYLDKKFFVEQTEKILKEKEDWGKNELGDKKKIIVEYSSPNIAKPFTVGHLRSTIIGDAISNILIFSGFEVIRDNHIGDWGTQFGKLMVAINKWGDIKQIEKSENAIKLLSELYIKFHEEAEKNPELEDEARASFKKLEQKDEEYINIWKKCVELSKKEFERIYFKLNVSQFDSTNGESFFEDKMKEVLDDVKQKNIGKESEGAFIIEFPEEKKLSPLLLLKKDGSSLYGLRDLATDKWRKKIYGDDIKIINEVGSEQTEYFRQIFEAEEMLGYFKKDQRIHVAHGLYRFLDGKMSTRKGNAIWLDDIIKEAEKRAGEINPETREMVALGALKFNDLKRDSLKDIVFNWEEILNIKGDSGAYLQYTAVRANSIVENSVGLSLHDKKEIPEEIINLERMLYRFPELVERSSEEFTAHHIASYLVQISSEFNNFYANTKILDEENRFAGYHLDLVKAFFQTTKNALNLLGIQIPVKM
ncbi:MAG: arginine--tRNA ligase [Patescibacteria group bacterium]